jgi:hypothetical protein
MRVIKKEREEDIEKRDKERERQIESKKEIDKLRARRR